MRARELGLGIGLLEPGEHDAITDVPGVRVGHTTLISGEGPLVVGQGPVRTGVTVVIPHEDDVWTEPLFAGCHRLNGNGELTGLEWVRESGLLGGVVGITNTHSVGVVRDALVAHAARAHATDSVFWSLPVVGETYDGALNDINGFHVKPHHVDEALAAAASGPVAEGNVGGGVGMICHEFKGGIGTASRRTRVGDGGYSVGALVQANYGSRELLRIDGVPVGQHIPTTEVPSAWDAEELVNAGGTDASPWMGGSPGIGGSSRVGPGGGSIIVVLATDAPLLPHQCERLAQRASLGLGRMGSIASHGSGDIFIAFATGNRGLARTATARDARETVATRTVVDRAISPLFQAATEAVEAAVVAALLAGETLVGRDGITAHKLDQDRLLDVMARYGRGPRARAS
ncbi:MAG TPA: P1 family peptidase [Candidatus Limnocylindrales bacterium]|nr:P1 family peptidase [Candidatus Limnocylindrales bacterium]